MTYEEIKKALECCIKPTSDCANCPYFGEEDCFDTAKRDALNLIVCQQAEIERLREELASKDLKYSLLEREKAEDISGFVDELKLVRAEAIKELAQQMKKRFLKLEYRAKTPRKTIRIEELQEQMDWVLHSVSIETIDNLVKEMVGEQE